MGHVATIALKFRDPAALSDAAAVCSLDLRQEVVTFYDGTRVAGTALRLPGWCYPVVVDAAGRLHYDHYEGHWGDLAHLHHFRQVYAEAATARFARARGYLITRTAQADGTVRLALSR